MTPIEFANKMFELEEKYGDDTEELHYEMDGLMCEALSYLGYSGGINIFSRNQKWYA